MEHRSFTTSIISSSFIYASATQQDSSEQKPETLSNERTKYLPQECKKLQELLVQVKNMKAVVQATICPRLESLHNLSKDENDLKLDTVEARTADLEMAVLVQVQEAFDLKLF